MNELEVYGIPPMLNAPFEYNRKQQHKRKECMNEDNTYVDENCLKYVSKLLKATCIWLQPVWLQQRPRVVGF